MLFSPQDEVSPLADSCDDLRREVERRQVHFMEAWRAGRCVAEPAQAYMEALRMLRFAVLSEISAVSHPVSERPRRRGKPLWSLRFGWIPAELR